MVYVLIYYKDAMFVGYPYTYTPAVSMMMGTVVCATEELVELAKERLIVLGFHVAEQQHIVPFVMNEEGLAYLFTSPSESEEATALRPPQAHSEKEEEKSPLPPPRC
jgi:hypothetical protein